ncbi:MAG TPA: signal peptidase I [Rudaea sp.]|jgi:signal peptidase I|nr:signal peptidase I [Rudaea sp.]
MRLASTAKKIFAANKALLVFFGVMMVFRSAFADWMLVPTGSMNPTIVEGDRILVNKMAYGLRIPFTMSRLTNGENPKRGDIVIFPSPKDGTTLVKRVVGLPGETVEMRDERLMINGKSVDYSTSNVDDADLPQATRKYRHEIVAEKLSGQPHPIMTLPERSAARTFGPVHVPDGEYLVLGDNRDNSEDSRYIGFIPRDSIYGRAFGVAYSLDADRWYRPRFDRTLTTLR